MAFALIGFGFSMNGQVEDPKCYEFRAGTYSQVTIPGGTTIFACTGPVFDCIMSIEVECDDDDQEQ